MSDFITDYGEYAYVTNLREDTGNNLNFRTAIWTGKHLQATLMCIPVCGEIGLEVHPDTDQFLYIESGKGIACMGASHDNLTCHCPFYECYAIFIPAGTWHNIINTGNSPLKLFTVYAPPHHPHGTIHQTKEQADMEES